jgi:glycosyltransferase involved in cell wall biosynthesis
VKFSIVTPSFNQGRFIARTIQSVQQQADIDWEHVVFDGGSTDNTVSVLQSFPSVRWTSEKDRGQAHAVNKGISATDGEIIGWLNSDDIYYEGALALVQTYFSEHPEIDVVYGMADHIDEGDTAFEEYQTTPFDLEALKTRCFICQPALFFRRSVIARHGALDERLQYCMDYELWLRWALQGVRFAYLPKKLAGSRLYETNKTLGARVRVHKEINDMTRERLGRVPDTWLYNYAHALVGSKIDRLEQPRKFAIRVGVESLLAALRWNRSVSRPMRARVAEWVGFRT